MRTVFATIFENQLNDIPIKVIRSILFPMSTENTPDKKNCGSKNKAMFAYGIIQLGSNVVSAAALAAIALSLCSVKKESKVFNNCVSEIQMNGMNSAEAVRYCNGGK